MNNPFIAGNWKANGSAEKIKRWANGFDPNGVEAVLCVPHPYLALSCEMLSGKAKVSAQDVAIHAEGAHTGNTTAAMVADCGATYTLVGHSERRAKGETSEQTKEKLAMALAAGLSPILCVGETLESREAGELDKVLAGQLDVALVGLPHVETFIVAYEPVWAIGTGIAATAKQAGEACALTRKLTAEHLGGARIKILYGGSVKQDNAADFMGEDAVDGLLVGGASLDHGSFSGICLASAKA